MRIIEPSYEILTPISYGGVDELKRIEEIGRICYKSEGQITKNSDSAKKFIKMLINKGHEAMLEHSSLSVKFIVDRGIANEIVRHRIASYAQESTRYCNYSNDKFNNEISVVDITGITFDPKMNQLDYNTISEIIDEWKKAMEEAEAHYLKMIDLGATPQIARSVLPLSTKTELVMTANYREWRNFFKLRTSPAAHPQMREITTQLLADLKNRLPIIFDDIFIEELHLYQ